MEERMTMCNMSIEGGARAGLVALRTIRRISTSRVVRICSEGRGLGRCGRATGARLPSDEGAAYDRELTIDADTLEPMVTFGTNPGMGIRSTVRRSRSGFGFRSNGASRR
jgi:3-isopropylmalate/(R)-2-methylmalate dehydratase large subunit